MWGRGLRQGQRDQVYRDQRRVDGQDPEFDNIAPPRRGQRHLGYRDRRGVDSQDPELGDLAPPKWIANKNLEPEYRSARDRDFYRGHAPLQLQLVHTSKRLFEKVKTVEALLIDDEYRERRATAQASRRLTAQHRWMAAFRAVRQLNAGSGSLADYRNSE